MSGRASLRASDADREQVADRLRHAATEGRLLPDELDERLGAAFAARTYGELDVLLADLPSTGLDRRRSSRELGPRHTKVAPVVALTVGAIVLAVVAAAFSGHPHTEHHGFGGFGAAPIVWLVWLAIGLRFILHRRHGLR
jgi:hypothetical protein